MSQCGKWRRGRRPACTVERRPCGEVRCGKGHVHEQHQSEAAEQRHHAKGQSEPGEGARALGQLACEEVDAVEGVGGVLHVPATWLREGDERLRNGAVESGCENGLWRRAVETGCGIGLWGSVRRGLDDEDESASRKERNGLVRGRRRNDLLELLEGERGGGDRACHVARRGE